MEPEEIDKLFRDKLAGRQAVPSPEAWMRLQQKMAPPKEQKNRWLYYAAASVVLLLMAGLLLLEMGLEKPGPRVAVAPRAVPPADMPMETPAASQPPAKKPSEPTLAQTPAKAQPKPVLAQAPARTARLSRKNPAKPRPLLPAQQEPAPAPELAIASQPASIQNAASPKALPSQPGPAGQQALAGTAPDLSVVEVVVQRDAASDPAQNQSLREQLSRKGQLLKNIYHQARNLKNGEPVELAAIGVDKDRIQQETKELKQKLTNVISL